VYEYLVSGRDRAPAATESPTRTRQPRVSLGVARDPGLAALRRALRAALIVPLALAFALFVLRDPQDVIFIVFGCFALLVISDFGGLRPARAAAYLTATLVGAVLVALGTLASANPVLAAASMLVIGVVLTFARVFGGYAAAGQTGMLLAFVIAVSIPASVSTIPARVEGWVLAGIISTLAAVFLWPRFERVMLHKHAAKACLSIANLVEGLRASSVDLDGLIAAARQAEQRARQQYAATAKRPAGPTRRDRAFVELLTELQRTVDIIERPFNTATRRIRPGIAEGDRLTAAVVAALRGGADVLTGGTPPDLRAVEDARTAHRTALDRWAAEQLRAGRPANEVLDGLDVDHTLRVVSYLAIALGTNAIIAAGGRPDVAVRLPAAAPRREGAGGVLVRVLRTIRTHLVPTSTVLQSSLRVGIGLALAVLVARLLGLSHSFWVVLGTVQVLRSTALGTGRSTVAALIGNVVGVAIGGLFAFLAGNHPAIMWASLPIVVFGAAYAATAIGFGASQAAFTINLIVVFNLISPAGWQIGLVRIEDLAVGAAISLVVGLLLWPRGARRELARAVSGFYRAVVAYLDVAFDRILAFDRPGRLEPVLRIAVQARDRAGEAFDAFLNERGRTTLDPQTAGLLLAAGNHAMLAGDALELVSSGMGYRAEGCPDGARLVQAQVRALLNDFLELAEQLSLSEVKQPVERVSVEALRHAARECLRHWRNDEHAGRGAMAVVIASEWVQNLARFEGDLARPVLSAAEAARIPWWR